eukprot:3693319-Alexandrium_andersonii.AAC.1
MKQKTHEVKEVKANTCGNTARAEVAVEVGVEDAETVNKHTTMAHLEARDVVQGAEDVEDVE